MDRAGIERMLRDSYDARRREDMDGVLRHFAEDASFRIVANERLGEIGRTLKGHVEMRPALGALFADWDWHDFPIRALVIDMDAQPVRAVVHCGGTMLHAPSGERVEAETLDLITIEDGRITAFVEFSDTHMLAQVAGLS